MNDTFSADFVGASLDNAYVPTTTERYIWDPTNKSGSTALASTTATVSHGRVGPIWEQLN
jgi:hypothetical protein